MISTKPIHKISLTLLIALLVTLPLSTVQIHEVGAQTTYYVTISGFAFIPQNLTIQRGDTVVWNNTDLVIYTLWFVNLTDGSTYLLSDPINPGATWSHTFNDVVDLQYYDFDRLWITAFLNVTEKIPPFYWKGSYADYAPSGVPDFDQRQDAWQNFGKWTWCGPLAVANSLWWFDSKFEPNPVPPPTINDGFPLVTAYGAAWDDHDPLNVQPFVNELAWLMDTDGNRTGLIHSGTNVFDMEAGIAQYLIKKGVNPRGDANGDGITDAKDRAIVTAAMETSPGVSGWNLAADLIADNIIDGLDLAEVDAGMGNVGKFYEKTVKMPTFEYIEDMVEKSEDVILLLGFWQFDGESWIRIGGHFVTVSGVDSANMLLAFSDPIKDNAELGFPGRVLPPGVPHNHVGPPETIHNNASFVSHDIYLVGTSPSPGGVIGTEEYEVYDIIENFEGQNFPEEFIPQAGPYNPAYGTMFTEIEYAVIVSPSYRYIWDQPHVTVQGTQDFDYTSWSGWWVRLGSTGVNFTFRGLDPMQIVSEYVDVEFSLGITNHKNGEKGLDGLLDVVINPGVDHYLIENVLFDNLDPTNHVYDMTATNGTYETKAHITVHKSFIHDGTLAIKLERHIDTNSAPTAPVSTNQPISLGTQESPTPIIPANVYEDDDPHTVHIHVATDPTGTVAAPGEVVMRLQWLAPEIPATFPTDIPGTSYVWDQPFVAVQGTEDFDYGSWGGWWVRHSSTGVKFTFTGLVPAQIVSEYLDITFNLGVTNHLNGEKGLDALLDVVINPGVDDYLIQNVLFDNRDPTNHIYSMTDPNGTYETKAHVTVHKSFIHDGNLTIKVERHIDDPTINDPALTSVNEPIGLGTQDNPTPEIPPNVYEDDDPHTVHIHVATDPTGTVAAPGEVVMRLEWMTVVVTIPGDINGDGTVDIFDAIILAVAFGSEPGDPYWNPNADINDDDIIDIFDAIILATNFGKTAP